MTERAFSAVRLDLFCRWLGLTFASEDCWGCRFSSGELGLAPAPTQNLQGICTLAQAPGRHDTEL